MEFKNSIRDIMLFNIISPAILLVALFIYFSLPQSSDRIYFIVLFLGLDFISNLYTLFKTYNTISMRKDTMTITKGIIGKKEYTFRYKDIKGIQLVGNRLPGWKRTNALIPLKGFFYNPKRDKFKIYHGCIHDLDFEYFERELRKRMNIEEDYAPY